MNEAMVRLSAKGRKKFMKRIMGIPMAVFFTVVVSVDCAFGQVVPDAECTVRGRVEAIRSVVVVPQIEGYVSKVCFPEGGLVKTGDLLFQLEGERCQYQVDLCEAELFAATSVVKHTQREYERMTSADSRGITQVEIEAMSLQNETAKANERQARANLAIAMYDLEKTKLKASISGRIGASAVCSGSYVSPIHEPLAQIVQIDPVRVVFPITASEYVRYKRSKKPLAEVFRRVRIVLSDGTIYDQTGQVDFENNVINESDGKLWLGATFQNPNQLLLPNVEVTVMVETCLP